MEKLSPHSFHPPPPNGLGPHPVALLATCGTESYHWLPGDKGSILANTAFGQAPF